ncbi:hypothetical protein MMC25_003243 [Agyrium rufum]|nr:hypothetical protein [Agyrium rufum]
MSTLLWKYFLDNDVDSFRLLLQNANYSAANTKSGGGGGLARAFHHGQVGHGGGGGGGEHAVGSPGKGLLSTSPTAGKSQKQNALGSKSQSKPFGDVYLTRADINAKDARGVTVLHLAASSNAESASEFAAALINTPLVDVYLQDLESGWTALHRALYFGNATIARTLMVHDSTITGGNHLAGGLIKIKDREGYSPFDVYGQSIADRLLSHDNDATISSGMMEEDEDLAQGDNGDESENGGSRMLRPKYSLDGEELFTFGSNKNITLGFGDEDDRQYPERILLKRPEHLLRRMQTEHKVRSSAARSRQGYPRVDDGPQSGAKNLVAVVQFQPIIIQDVQLAKFHTAVLTTDSEANLYVCGFGTGGRLGTGDERTRFNLTPIYGGGLAHKKVISIALGQNHTIAITTEGEVFTWGSNGFGQLGYSMPPSGPVDEDPVQSLPRQVFGPLKRELATGAAASRLHSVIHTGASLYTFGKNEGQLGLVDSDARLLAIQNTPRKVAASLFSSLISMVSAIDKATICLLENHEVWIFANYGYTKMSFPLDNMFTKFFLKEKSNGFTATVPIRISKIRARGDTICAMSDKGDVFTTQVSQKTDPSPQGSSTTNPAKIRSALSTPQRIWSNHKSHMAVRDVDVGQDGSVIICTQAGSVWRRVKRAKVKDANAMAALTDYKPKDYKFSRVPSLTRVVAVRSNAFGAFAAIRKDCDVLRTQVQVSAPMLWKDMLPLCYLRRLVQEEVSDTEEPAPRFWRPAPSAGDPHSIRQAILKCSDLERRLDEISAEAFDDDPSASLFKVGTTENKALMPCHDFLLAGRSSVMRHAFDRFRRDYFFGIPEVLSIEYDKDGNIILLFHGLDIFTIVNLVFYIYTDSVVNVWQYTQKMKPELAQRYKNVRVELMRLAATLEMRSLEQAVRVMVPPPITLHKDLDAAILEPNYLESGDVEIQLEDGTAMVHGDLLCRRCPFFEGLFHGRARGAWLTSRREVSQEKQEPVKVDLEHVTLDVFRLVLRHIYADTGEELFDEVVTPDEDSFLDLIMDVMAAANELMLDRLSQVCQKLLGRHVNLRNVCQLLNAVAPCSVADFKNTALEYITLNLEAMLENHLLNELEDDLMLELDEVIRANQTACFPIGRSNVIELDLLDRHPELQEIMERNKQAKIDSMSLRSRLHEDEVKFESGRAKGDKESEDSPTAPRQSPSTANSIRADENRSPSLRAQRSINDLMFDFHDEPELRGSDRSSSDVRPGSSRGKTLLAGYDPNHLQTPAQSSISRDTTWYDSKGRKISESGAASPFDIQSGSPTPGESIKGRQKPPMATTADSEAGKPQGGAWGTVSITAEKFDMKDILGQPTRSPTSNLTSAISQQLSESFKGSIAPPKVSQKERKKQMQQRKVTSDFAVGPEPKRPEIPSSSYSASAWQTAYPKPRTSLRDMFGEDDVEASLTASTPSRASPSILLTLRQTISGKVVTQSKATTPSGTPPPPLQHRSVSASSATNQPLKTASTSPRPPTQTRQSFPVTASTITSPSTPVPIRSIRHNTTPATAEASLNLPLADILSQQQTEKDIIKEAVTSKRSLQEIQEEQAFQEWWDQESKKAMEEEQALVKNTTKADKAKNRFNGRGRGRGRGRGGGAGVSDSATHAAGKSDGDVGGNGELASKSVGAQGPSSTEAPRFPSKAATCDTEKFPQQPIAQRRVVGPGNRRGTSSGRGRRGVHHKDERASGSAPPQTPNTK